jgi:hypothetical protein
MHSRLITVELTIYSDAFTKFRQKQAKHYQLFSGEKQDKNSR